MQASTTIVPCSGLRSLLKETVLTASPFVLLHQAPGFEAARKRLALKDPPDMDAAADELHLASGLAAALRNVSEISAPIGDGGAGSGRTEGGGAATAMPLLLGAPAGHA